MVNGESVFCASGADADFRSVPVRVSHTMSHRVLLVRKYPVSTGAETLHLRV